MFGTNGRLTLSNPRLSLLWKVPTNLLEQHPHIDQIAEAVAEALPEDGATIWRGLKRNIIDLNPTRTDQQGRIARADGKLIAYAVTRMPFIAGDRFTAAGLYVGSHLGFGMQFGTIEKRPAFVAYHAKVADRPAAKRAAALDDAAMPKQGGA